MVIPNNHQTTPRPSSGPFGLRRPGPPTRPSGAQTVRGQTLVVPPTVNLDPTRSGTDSKKQGGTKSNYFTSTVIFRGVLTTRPRPHRVGTARFVVIGLKVGSTPLPRVRTGGRTSTVVTTSFREEFGTPSLFLPGHHRGRGRSTLGSDTTSLESTSGDERDSTSLSTIGFLRFHRPPVSCVLTPPRTTRHPLAPRCPETSPRGYSSTDLSLSLHSF